MLKVAIFTPFSFARITGVYHSAFFKGMILAVARRIASAARKASAPHIYNLETNRHWRSYILRGQDRRNPRSSSSKSWGGDSTLIYAAFSVVTFPARVLLAAARFAFASSARL